MPAPPRFKNLRIAILLTILFAVAIYAWRDHALRHSRNQWRRTLRVALVLVEHDAIGPEVTDLVRARGAVLETVLESEARRYLGDRLDPFDVRILGPTTVALPAPVTVDPGILGLLRHTASLWRYVFDVDRTLGLDADDFDARIYLAAHAPQGKVRFLEGVGQQGGRLGVVEVELTEDMVDFALIVATHELFHTLGATDRYDEYGQTRVPDGLAEPDKEPLFPQRYVEIMARNRPVAPGREVPPESIDELRVGPMTARELGWIE